MGKGGDSAYLAFPTGVGMNRFANSVATVMSCVPHRRGDEPPVPLGQLGPGLRSPQAWG